MTWYLGAETLLPMCQYRSIWTSPGGKGYLPQRKAVSWADNIDPLGRCNDKPERDSLLVIIQEIPGYFLIEPKSHLYHSIRSSQVPSIKNMNLLFALHLVLFQAYAGHHDVPC